MAETSSSTSILLTGFGPFPEVPQNISGDMALDVARRLQQERSELTVKTVVLPTEWRGALHQLDGLLRDQTPDLVFHFGVSNDIEGIAIESSARNTTCAAPDALGHLPPLHCLVEGAADVLNVKYDTAGALARLKVLGLSAGLSSDAGDYLCNAVLYHSLLHAGDTGRAMIAGFIHLPDRLDKDAPEQPALAKPRRNAALCALSWDEAVVGSVEVITFCLAALPDAP